MLTQTAHVAGHETFALTCKYIITNYISLSYGAVTLQRMSQRMLTYEENLSERWHTSRTLGIR